MQKRLAWLVRWELWILLLASPLLLFPNGTYGLGMAVVPLLWAVRRAATGRFVVPTRFDLPVMALLAMTGIGQLVSTDPAFSLSKCAGVVLGVGTYYAVVGLTGGALSWLGTLILFVGLNVGVAGISLFATAWGSKFPLFEPLLARLPRLIQNLPGSPPDGFNPNGVAGILLFGLPLFVVLTITRHHRLWPAFGRWALPARLVMGVATVFILLLFIATQSRAGYISLALALAILPVLPHPRRLGAITILGLISVLLFWFSPYRAPLVESAAAFTTVTGRVQLWERAAAGIGDFPFTGVGLGMFRFVQPRLYPLNTVPPQTDIGHAHNQFLQAGLDVGIPGLLAYLALWIGAAGLGAEVLWRRRETPAYPVMLGLMAGWLGHFAWAFTETQALGSKAGWLWWWALALICATYQRTRRDPL